MWLSTKKLMTQTCIWFNCLFVRVSHPHWTLPILIDANRKAPERQVVTYLLVDNTFWMENAGSQKGHWTE